MSRGFQYDYAQINPGVFDRAGRRRKAETMAAVLGNFIQGPLASLNLLNVGGSAGAIDIVLAEHFASVLSVDIDAPAIAHAREHFQRENLRFLVADAQRLHGDLQVGRARQLRRDVVGQAVRRDHVKAHPTDEGHADLTGGVIITEGVLKD